ncbi:MAG: STAS domain-containing protein [Treponema sp.]|nr:STAS domain-containing protein [Treponema sp.]
MDDNNALITGFDSDRDSSLTISLRKAEGIDSGIFIYLNGYIDTYNSNFFQKQVNKIIDAGFLNLIFNCSALSYVSSTGIGSFASFLKILKSKGGEIVMQEVQPKVYEVFQLLGFSQFFNIKANLEEVLDFFKHGGTPTFGSVFPLLVRCPVCDKKLRSTKPGHFRCSGCRSIISINEMGSVSLG